MTTECAERVLLDGFARALGVDPARVAFDGPATLASAYPVTDFAAASVAASALAIADLVAAVGGRSPEASVRRDLAEAWFRTAVRPSGWEPPAPWDPIAGDYRASDGWIRLHTNAQRHRAAALRVLGTAAERDAVAAAVATWEAQALEDAVVDAGGAAALMRTAEAWAAHPQGVALAAEPLVARSPGSALAGPSTWDPDPARPLRGARILDLTRVLAGPVATRLLAGLGATVLRVDPPDWDEPALEPDMTLGKRAARLDARAPDGAERLRELLASADAIVHGYRSDALEGLGLGEAERRAARPGLIDVSLDAYGFTGPWARRRGFDSLVQMSAGIAEHGMRAAGADRPVPLPVQALDHATGYLVAAAAIRAFADRARDGVGSTARLSLARTALELERVRDLATAVEPGAPAEPLPSTPITTPWGPADLLEPPFVVEGVGVAWSEPPRPLGADAPRWPA